jgi:FxLD family lantipeptide
MSPTRTTGHAQTLDAVIDDAEFELDMRVVESTTQVALGTCDTSDGCGSTCATTACSTASNNPF